MATGPLHQITVSWSSARSPGGTSVLHFDAAATPITTFRSELQTMLTAFNPVLAQDTFWRIAEEGKILDSATGALLGLWNEGPTMNSHGTGAGNPVANATQALLRWNTGLVVAGRVLKGRTFIPGVLSDLIDDGELDSGAHTIMTNAASALVNDVALAVWHRPKSGTGGSYQPAVSATVWNEFAVLRHRR